MSHLGQNHLDLELDIQRCIDGQMSEGDQHALLRRLESLPDGWRQLSLAFVENQVWSQSILKKEEPIVSRSTVSEPRPVRRTSFGLWGKIGASMAAGIMAGLVIHRQWPVASPVDPRPAVAVAASTGGAESPSPQSPVSANTAASLASNGPGSPEILSPQARRQLRQSGYAIDEGQVYYSIPMSDGRHYVVPVNTVRVRNAVQ